MGFFNEIGKKTTEATSKITKETKLKLKINENKNKISDIYEEIGKKVYEKHVREENISIKEELQEECAKIDELSKEIEEARKEILQLNNKRQCPNCYAEIEKDAAFCSKCGHKLENIVGADASVCHSTEEIPEEKVEDVGVDASVSPSTEENLEKSEDTNE